MYKRTKIVCTMGPACDNDDTLREMILAGMNVARFNFSHGSYEEHHGRIERVKRIAAELDTPIGILLDTKGPEIRTGLLENHEKISVHAGDKITVTAQPTTEDFLGNANHISLDYLALPSEVEKGSKILIDDGLIELTVESVEGQDMHCIVENDGEIGEHKGINVPNVHISLPAITERDREDILFGLSEGIDYIAASFIRNGNAVREIRKLCDENGGEHVSIFPKIECAMAIKNFDDILKASNGVMVARGDLGIEVPAELVPHFQKTIIAKCNAAYKPVITATQMLDSMIRNPRPTRAEVADVANAIYDGTDAVMLSGETAAGQYPVEAVKMQASIAHETEKHLAAHGPLQVPEGSTGTRVINNVVGLSAVNMATTVGAKCIITPSVSGATARVVSKFKPKTMVIGVTPDERTLRRMQIYWGVLPMKSIQFNSTEDICSSAIELVCAKEYAETGDIVILTAGLPSRNADKGREGASNMMRIAVIE